MAGLDEETRARLMEQVRRSDEESFVDGWTNEWGQPYGLDEARGLRRRVIIACVCTTLMLFVVALVALIWWTATMDASVG